MVEPFAVSRAGTSHVVHARLGQRLPIVLEPMPNTYSISLAVWLLQGSRDEAPEENGIAHFLEHMFFKGTRSRSVFDIARLLDRIGGRVDAFTTKEYVCFYARVLHEHQELITELFADLVLNPRFDPVEMEKERMVIIEELRGAEDDPQEFAFDRFLEALWSGHGLGRPVGGTIPNILRVRHRHLLDYFRRQVFPENLLFTAVGAFDPATLEACVESNFAPLLERHGEPSKRNAPETHRFAHLWHKPGLEQAHIFLGGPGLSLIDPRRYAYGLLINILGGGMSSRLFMKIREELGLAYHVSASAMPFSDVGIWYVYAGTAPDRLPDLIGALAAELDRMRRDSIDAAELELAKSQARANYFMGWESSSERMFTRAKQFVYGEPFEDIEARVKRLEAVTVDEIAELARDLFDEGRISALILGDIDDKIVKKIVWPVEFEMRSVKGERE